MIRRSYLGLSIAATLLSLGTPAMASGESMSPPVQVRSAKMDAGAGAHWVAATLAAAQSATLSTRLAASVQSVHAEEGMQVRKGQLLVVLTGDDVRAQLRAAEAALQSASAHLQRITQLAAQRAATQSELELAQSQRAQAAAAVAAARTSLGYTEIRAPFAATVQARRVNAGDLVGPGQPLVELTGSELEIQATLSEVESTVLRLGQKLSFQVGERQGVAVITALTPGGDPLSHRRALRARLSSGAEGLRSGSFVRIGIPGTGSSPENRWIPRSALVERGDLAGVFVAQGGRAQLRWLSLGEPAGDRYPVRAGLRPDDVVIDMPGTLRDGEQVEVASGNR